MSEELEQSRVDLLEGLMTFRYGAIQALQRLEEEIKADYKQRAEEDALNSGMLGVLRFTICEIIGHAPPRKHWRFGGCSRCGLGNF